MEYKELGNSGVKVSKIGLGGWQLAQADSWGPTDIDEFQEVIDYAVEKGLNFIDTAEGYGKSEETLGELLQGKRDKVILATKIGSAPWDYPRVREKLEASLKKLRTDYVDLYQIHWPRIKHIHGSDMEKKDYEDIFDSTSRLKKEGLIRLAGLSNFRLHHLKEFGKDALDFIVSNQVPYSLLWRFYDVEGIADFCREKAISFLPYSPLAQGLLSGRFGKGGEEIAGTRKRGILYNEPVYSRALRVVDVVKEIAEETGAAPAQVALKWAMEKDTVATVIAGARKAEHIRLNVDAVEIRLTGEQMDRLEKASMEFQKTLPPGLELWISVSKDSAVKRVGIKQ